MDKYGHVYVRFLFVLIVFISPLTPLLLHMKLRLLTLTRLGPESDLLPMHLRAYSTGYSPKLIINVCTRIILVYAGYLL